MTRELGRRIRESRVALAELVPERLELALGGRRRRLVLRLERTHERLARLDAFRALRLRRRARGFERGEALALSLETLELLLQLKRVRRRLVELGLLRLEHRRAVAE